MTPYTDEQKADLAKRIEALCEALAGLDLNDAHDLYANAALIPRALTAIRQLQNPWLPIESAPRDGTIAVLYSPRDWETSVTPARKMAIQLEVAVLTAGNGVNPERATLILTKIGVQIRPRC